MSDANRFKGWHVNILRNPRRKHLKINTLDRIWYAIWTIHYRCLLPDVQNRYEFSKIILISSLKYVLAIHSFLWCWGKKKRMLIFIISIYRIGMLTKISQTMQKYAAYSLEKLEHPVYLKIWVSYFSVFATLFLGKNYKLCLWV